MREPAPIAQGTIFDSAIVKPIRLVVGLIVLVASFVSLWHNEGRVDVSAMIMQSKPAAAEGVDPTLEGELVSVTGAVKSKQLLGDPGFLNFGPFIMLHRKVEMYAWVERISTEGQDGRTDREKREPGCFYERVWADTPADSDFFFESEGHKNPAMPLQDLTYAVDEATIGAYRFFPISADLPTGSPVSLSRKNYIQTLGTSLHGDYIFIGKGKMEDPQVGDVRMSYSAIKSGAMVTLVGRLSQNKVNPYLWAENKQIYRLLVGSREAAFAQLSSLNKAAAWILRLAGLLIMWGGLFLCFEPLNARFKLFPALEGIGQIKTGAILLAVAVAFTLLTLLVFMLMRNVFVLGIALATVCIALWFFSGRQISLPSVSRLTPSRRHASTPPQPVGPTSTGPAMERSTLSLHDAHVRHTDPSDSEESEPLPGAEPQRHPRGDVKIVCENCGLGYTVPASYQGRKVRCHKCEHKFYIPLGYSDDDSSPTVMDTFS